MTETEPEPSGASSAAPQTVMDFAKDVPQSGETHRLDAPAFHRNHEAIVAVLKPLLGGLTGAALEVGSGTGQHALVYAREFPGLDWYPTDMVDSHLCSIEAWRDGSGLGNLHPPRRLNLLEDWRRGAFPRPLRAVLCLNVIHIAPWSVAENLFAFAGAHLGAGDLLYLYGPYKRHGQHVSDSNQAFDASLRARDPAWGVRDMGDVQREGALSGFQLKQVSAMPANNFSLVFRKQPV